MLRLLLTLPLPIISLLPVIPLSLYITECEILHLPAGCACLCREKMQFDVCGTVGKICSFD